MPPLLTDDEFRDGKDEPGVLDGNCIDGGFEALSIRGGKSGTAKTVGKILIKLILICCCFSLWP